jgi:hypothetical protein
MSKLAKEFDKIKLLDMGREKNQFVDALAILTSMAKINYGNIVQLISIAIRNSLAHYCSIDGEMNRNLWYYDIKQFLQH